MASTDDTLELPSDSDGSAHDAAVLGFSSAARRCETTDQLEKLSIDLFMDLGVNMLSYHHLPAPGASDYSDFVQVITHGFPESWTKRYKHERLYRIDPIPKEALDACRPYRWSEVGDRRDLSQAERRFMEYLVEQKLGDGLAIAVFGPHGRNGYIGLGCGPTGHRASDAEVDRYHLIAQAAHLRYCELLCSDLPSYAALSEREREILAWIAKGKSNGVMAEILELSPNTVDTYVRRIFRKLQVGDRVTAALRGLALGLIG